MSDQPSKRRSRNKLDFTIKLLQYLQEHQGVSLSELTETFQFRKKSDCVNAINKLSMIGRPPFSPGDYLDVYIEGDRVFCTSTTELSAPLRLTIEETLFLEKLYANQDQFEDGMDPVVDLLQEHRRRHIYESATTWTEIPATVRMARGKTVKFVYKGEHRKAVIIDLVRPDGRISGSGHYVLSWDIQKKDFRMFRLDRFESEIEILQQKAPVVPEPPYSLIEQLNNYSFYRYTLYLTARSSLFVFFRNYCQTSIIQPLNASAKIPAFLHKYLPESAQKDLILAGIPYTHRPNLLDTLADVLTVIKPIAVLENGPGEKRQKEEEVNLVKEVTARINLVSPSS